MPGGKPYELAPEPGAAGVMERLQSAVGQLVSLDGVLTPPVSLKTPVPIRVIRVR